MTTAIQTSSNILYQCLDYSMYSTSSRTKAGWRSHACVTYNVRTQIQTGCENRCNRTAAPLNQQEHDNDVDAILILDRVTFSKFISDLNSSVPLFIFFAIHELNTSTLQHYYH